jgi:hypothetical protein
MTHQPINNSIDRKDDETSQSGQAAINENAGKLP